jgi:hypothetical protein
MAVSTPVLTLKPVLIMHAFCAAWALGYSWMAFEEYGTVRLAAQGFALTGFLLWVAVARLTLVPRSRGPVEPRADGSVVVETPAVVVACLLAAWLVLLVSVGVWLVVAATDFEAIESPGAMFVVVVAALGSLRDLARLLTGRLHRWRVVADDDGIRYRGYHTAWTLPWSEVGGTRSQPRPPGVTVTSKDGAPARFLAALAYGVHPDAIAEALTRRRSRPVRR